MNKLIIVSVLLTGCATGNFKRGDCITPNPDKLEAWDNKEAAAKYKLVVLDSGTRNYRIAMQTPFGMLGQSAKKSDVDEIFTKGECPLNASLVLESFPSTVK